MTSGEKAAEASKRGEICHWTFIVIMVIISHSAEIPLLSVVSGFVSSRRYSGEDGIK